MKDKYQFRITNGAGAYYYVASGAVVTTADEDTALLDNAEGGCVVDWGKLAFNYKRHERYAGIFRSFTPETIRFVRDAAKILRYVRNTQGRLMAKAQLEVRRLKSTDQQYYLSGLFDFNFKGYTNSALYVDVGIMQGGLSSLVVAFENAKYALPIGDPTPGSGDYDSMARFVRLDGVLLKGRYNYISLKKLDADHPVECVVDETFASQVTVPVAYVDEEGPYALGVANSNGIGNVIWEGGDFDHAFAFKSIEQYTGKVSADMPVHIVNPTGTSASLELWAELRGPKPDVDLILRQKVASTLPIAAGSTVDTTLLDSTPSDFAFNPENYLIFFFKIIVGSGPDVAQLRITFPASDKTSNISVGYNYTQPTTVTRALSHWNMFQKLVGKVTGGAYGAKSDLLTTDVYPDDTYWSLNPVNTYFASGDALRRLHIDAEGNYKAPNITASLEDVYADAFLSNCAAIGIETIDDEEKVVLERLDHFYRPDLVIVDLGTSISDWEMTDYSKHIANTYKTGYADTKFDEGNGRFEWSSEMNWTTNQEQEKQDINYVAPFKVSPYETEYTRANLSNKKTTDSGSDNEVFKLQGNGNTFEMAGYLPHPQVLDRAQTVTEGLPADVAETVFNIPFSPKRQLLRMLPFLKSNYHGMPGAVLKFVSGTKNTGIKASMYIGSEVDEDADLNIGDGTGEIFFKPHIFKFKTEVKVDVVDIMATDYRYGIIKHTLIRNGKRYPLEGHIEDIEVKPGINDVYEITLRASKNCVIPDDL